MRWDILGIGSQARCAIRDVHRLPSGAARRTLSGKYAQHLLGAGDPATVARRNLACVDRYITLDLANPGGAYVLGPTKGTLVTFGVGNGVRARPDVVLGPDDNGAYEARVALLDDLPLSRAAAEMIALPIVEHVSLNFAGAPMSVVRVWQLALQQEEDVVPWQAQTQAVRQAVQTLLASA